MRGRTVRRELWRRVQCPYIDRILKGRTGLPSGTGVDQVRMATTSEPPRGLTVPPTLLARWRGNARQMQVLARNGPDHGRMPKAVLRVVGNIDDSSAALRRASSNHCSANLSNISRFFGSSVCPAACAQSCANHSYSAVSVITASAVLSRQRRYLVPFRATSMPSERAHVRDLVARAGTGLRSRAVAAGEALKSQGRREEPANFMHFVLRKRRKSQ